MKKESPSSASAACPKCGRLVKRAAREGLCPACLLGRALALSAEDPHDEEAEERLITAAGLEGKTLGDYEILSKLAEGGMGVVFRARQKNPRRIVALKVISSGELATPRAVERFHNEALAAARLSHPNIVPIYEVGEDGGWHFFSMELVEGRTLAEFIRDRPDPVVAAGLMIKIARAVEHAHRRGVLHRDLKPANILLDAQNEPHLTDFGLAKITALDSNMTRSHVVLGSPAYMAPEQAGGNSRDITTASDVYSLGIVLYEFLRGRPPFQAESTPALLRMILEEEPPPLPKDKVSKSSARRTSPGGSLSDLGVICFKCLEKVPQKRYATARELADDLQRWRNGEPIMARPVRAWERAVKWARRYPARTALAAVIILSGFTLTLTSLWFNVRLDRARELAEQNAARHREQLVREHIREAGRASEAGDALTGLFGLVNALRLEKENSAESLGIRRRVGLTLRSAPELLRLWDAGGPAYRIQFSADNHHLAAAMRNGDLRIWNLRDGTVTSHSPGPGEQILKIAFSPDGRQAAESLVGPPFVRVRPIEGGSAAALPLIQPCHHAVAFSGGGRWLITGGDRLRVWDAATLREIPLEIGMEGSWARVVSSPDDRLILALAPDGTGRLLDSATWRWRQTAEPIFSPAQTLPCFSPDGQWLATLTDKEIRLYQTESGKLVFSTPYSALVCAPSFSPDGQFFAAPSFRDQARVWALPSAANTNVTAFRLPIRHETGANQTVFSPDSRLLATAGFDYQLRLWHAGRHQLATPILHHTALVEAVAFSADGRFLASADARGLVRVWNLQPRGVITLPGVAAIPAAVFFKGGEQLIARDTQDRLRLFDGSSGIALGEPLYVPPGGPRNGLGRAERPQPGDGAPMDLALDGSERFLAVALGSEGLRIWELATRQLVASWTNAGVVLSAAFDPQAALVASGNTDGQVTLWSIATGQPVRKLSTTQGPANRLAWSPNRRWLAVGGQQSAEVWDANSGARLDNPLPVPDMLTALQFSGDSRRLLTAASNEGITPGAARLWDLPSLKANLPPMEHGDGVASAVFSPDGRWVATGGEDDVVRLWQANSSAAASRAMRHEAIISGLGFDRSSRWLAAGSNGGYLRIWSVPEGELSGPALPLASSTPTVIFSPDGDRIFAASHLENSALVSFAPDVSSLEEIEKAARGQTALRNGSNGALESASVAALAAEFGAQRLSGELFASATEAAQWHESLAVPAEALGAWFTAEFHLRRLAALRPDDQAIRQRLEGAIAERQRTASGR